MQVPILIHSVARATSKLSYQNHLLWERVPTSMVPPLRVRIPSAKIVQGSVEQVEAPRIVNEAATWVCRAPLFLVAMVSRANFSLVAVFKMVDTMS